MTISVESTHIIFFATNDLEKTIHFYRDFLGCKLYYSITDNENNSRLYIFEIENQLSIAFYFSSAVKTFPIKQPGNPVSGPWGFDHLMIGVETEEDLWILRDKFLMAGLEISDAVDHGHIYSIYAFDPNNISLEFSYETCNLRDLPMFVDGSASIVAEQGSFPQKGYWPEYIEAPNSYERKIMPGLGWDTIPSKMKNAVIRLTSQTEILVPHDYNYKQNSLKNPVSYKGFHTLFYATANMDQTIRFYRDLLGCKLYYSVGDPLGNFKLYLFEITEQLSFAFFQWQNVRPVPKKPVGKILKGQWWFDHIRLGVDSEDDLWKLKQKFENAGINTSEITDYGISYAFSTFDPNNMALEFGFDVYNVKNTPLLLDVSLEAAAKEGIFPQPGYWPDDLDITPQGQRRVLPGIGWDFIPADMKNAVVKVELPVRNDNNDDDDNMDYGNAGDNY